MANEAVKVYAESSAGDVIQDYIVANATALEKGTFVAISDPRTVVAPSALGQPCAGIVAREKIASDGRTQVSVYKKGYFRATASGAVVVGDPLVLSGHANYVQAPLAATTSLSGAAFIGYAEETAAATESFIMRLNL